MLRADLSRADVIFASTLALGDDLRRRLAEKLAKEVLPGAVVFSSTRLLGGPATGPTSSRRCRGRRATRSRRTSWARGLRGGVM